MDEAPGHGLRPTRSAPVSQSAARTVELPGVSGPVLDSAWQHRRSQALTGSDGTDRPGRPGAPAAGVPFELHWQAAKFMFGSSGRAGPSMYENCSESDLDHNDGYNRVISFCVRLDQ